MNPNEMNNFFETLQEHHKNAKNLRVIKDIGSQVGQKKLDDLKQATIDMQSIAIESHEEIISRFSNNSADVDWIKEQMETLKNFIYITWALGITLFAVLWALLRK